MLQYLLLPFAFVYGLILNIRHFLYDIKLLKSCSFEEAIIVIGNLSVGGTGKSPHTLYLAKLLEKQKPAILSRGYGRKTKGFRIVNANSSAWEVGDEPLMFKTKLSNSLVAVCENRCEGIKKLLSQDSQLNTVILDDAFQHRALKAGLSILLLDYSSLQSKFYLLPAGRRRDLYSRWKAADVVIITKTHEEVSAEEFYERFKGKPVFTSYYRYQNLTNYLDEEKPLELITNRNLVLVTGIADALQLKAELKKRATDVRHLEFADHQDFEGAALETIRENMVMFAPRNYLFITTSKDFTRLKPLLSQEEIKKWYIINIEVQLNAPKEFNKIIQSYVERTQRNRSIHK